MAHNQFDTGHAHHATGFQTATLVSWLVPPLCVVCLIWPALWNGYPIVFADTGTYLYLPDNINRRDRLHRISGTRLAENIRMPGTTLLENETTLADNGPITSARDHINRAQPQQHASGQNAIGVI
jgi:hypothetical protein